MPMLIAKKFNVTTVLFKLMTFDAMAYAALCMQVTVNELKEGKCFRQKYSGTIEEKLLLLVSGISESVFPFLPS